MKKSELIEYGKKIIENPVMPYDYILDKVNKEIHDTFFYNNQFYCHRCKKVTQATYVNEKKVFCKCKVCGHKDKVYKLRKNATVSRYNAYGYSVLDFQDNCLIERNYMKRYCYSFKEHQMQVEIKTFLIGVNVFDLISNLKVHFSRYISTVWFKKYFSLYAGVHKLNEPLFEYEIYALSGVENYFAIKDFFTSSVKNRFFKYIDIKKTNDFYNIYFVISFCKALYTYPKIETIYKNEVFNSLFTDKYSFFCRMIEHLRPRKKALPYNYKLMKKMYTCKLRWNYYKIGLLLKIMPVENNVLNDCFIALPEECKDISTYKYLQKQPYALYGDYLEMATSLGLNFSKNKIRYPKDLEKEHNELVSIVEEKKKIISVKKYQELFKDYELLLFEEQGYLFQLPLSGLEFKEWGNKLKICLFSAHYDERYLDKKCIILFINSKFEKDIYHQFAVELNRNLEIVQLHGFSNDINACSVQLEQKSIVKEILKKRLEILTMKKGKISYRNENFQSIGKEKERSVII